MARLSSQVVGTGRSATAVDGSVDRRARGAAGGGVGRRNLPLVVSVGRRVATPTRVAALGLVLGPAAFITAWAVAGSRMPEPYRPMSDAISRTAAVGSPQRGLMTSGFLLYAAGSAIGSLALRRVVPGPAWIASAVNAGATVGVALTPLEHSGSLDTAHAITATTGYVTLALTPILAAGPLAAAGRVGLARASVATGGAVGACLAATVASDDVSGLMQRLGLTIGDVWLIAAGLAIAAGRAATETTAPSDRWPAGAPLLARPGEGWSARASRRSS